MQRGEEEIRREEGRLELGEHTGRPQNAVLSVQFCRQCPSGQARVETVFHMPGGELAVTIERKPQPAMADDVVDGPEAIMGTADGCLEERVLTVSFIGGGDDLEDLAEPD